MYDTCLPPNTYKFVEMLFWDHGLDLADTITEGKFWCNDQLWLGLGIIGLVIRLPGGLLLGSVEYLVVDYLQNKTLILLELLNWCLRYLQDTVLRQIHWLWWSSIFGIIIWHSCGCRDCIASEVVRRWYRWHHFGECGWFQNQKAENYFNWLKD